MDNPRIVKKYRELQGLSRQELAKRANFSLSTVSRYEKGDPEVLTEENENRLFKGLNIIQINEQVRFVEDSFIKIPLSSSMVIMIPDYSTVYDVLDMYQEKILMGQQVTIFVQYLSNKTIIDGIGHRLFSMEPAFSLVMTLPENVTVYFQMKRGYLTNIEAELLTIQENYGARIIRGKCDWNIRFEKITLEDVERLIREIKRHPLKVPRKARKQ